MSKNKEIETLRDQLETAMYFLCKADLRGALELDTLDDDEIVRLLELFKIHGNMELRKPWPTIQKLKPGDTIS